MARIIVEYQPKLSSDTKDFIREKVTPSMTSTDSESCQYEISYVADVIESLGDYGNTKDLFFINDLINQGVHYIEF